MTPSVYRATAPSVRDRARALAPASARFHRRERVIRRVRTAALIVAQWTLLAVRLSLATLLLLGLMFGLPIVLWALAVALGADPLGGAS